MRKILTIVMLSLTALTMQAQVTIHGNVFGGARSADVGGEGANDAYATHVTVLGGIIEGDIYGGNDISGEVDKGTSIEIRSTVLGSVYGGGNGSYKYTNVAPDEGTANELYFPFTSVEQLNSYRPNVKSVRILITGEDAPEGSEIFVGGSVFCGGNSARVNPTGNGAIDLTFGPRVVADKVFLGCNGENLVKLYALSHFNSLDGINLTQQTDMDTYMNAVTMPVFPTVHFTNPNYTTKIGSFYCGGNVGSMKHDGLYLKNFRDSVVIYDKIVGGCNTANVAANAGVNAAYEGGILGNADTVGIKIRMNFDGFKIEPRELKRDDDGKLVLGTDGNPQLVWNTNGKTGDAARLNGGNVYGGCYESGHVNGNVEINILSDIVKKDEVFGNGLSGVTLENQRNDVLSTALNVFGGGFGRDSEIWGSTTINLKGGYAFKVFGGGDQGAVGKKDGDYIYNKMYSTTINLMGSEAATESNSVAEAEDVYGGGFKGLVAGDATVNLGNGRIWSSFGGACNADVLGHVETYIGKGGFPWVRNNVYGGNDLGGEIKKTADFTAKVSTDAAGKVYDADLPKGAAYVEYVEGRVGSIFGGGNGGYAYTNSQFPDYIAADGSVTNGFSKPRLANAFVNFKPNNLSTNAVTSVYGGSQGYNMEAYNNKMQDRSYVLVDIPQALTNFATTQVFGAGDYAGIGIGVNHNEASANADGVKAAAVIDLVRGQIRAAYGGSYQQGVTRRTIVNVPAGSTIVAQNLFAGAYGVKNDVPCDVYEGTLNYNSGDATITGALYGGNNAFRRTLYGTVNVGSTVWSNRSLGYNATVYGAGFGADCWSRNTTVNLNDGAKVYEVYGGGNAGKVLNQVTETAWKNEPSANLYTDLDGGYTDTELETLAKENRLGSKTNTNVYINQGALVGNYGYGGGYGSSAVVSGTTYIGLHGGTVVKDLYGGGTSGAVEDWKGVKSFTAGTNAYIEGGTLRNVYGGGWEGSVGHHTGGIDAPQTDDIEGTTNVVIGIRKDQASLPGGYGFYKGVPAVQRNAYAGGEGGAVFGTASITLNNGYIGYVYKADGTDDPATEINEHYEEKLHDETWTDHVGLNRLEGSGNVFGGGYIDNSSVDFTNVKMMGGWVRNSLFGGGEIAAIGRGKVTVGGYKNSERTYEGTYKQGKTHVEMYNGHVRRDVFGGGKGYDNLGRVGTLYTDGYVFGQTEVYIRGGEVGTETNYADGYGNVFGGGDIGYVYGIGTADTEGEKPSPNHYYYKDDDGKWTEDCKVVVEPYAQVLSAGGVTIDGTSYAQYDYVPTDKLNLLKGRTQDSRWNNLDDKGIVIRNAVFAGGNVDVGSDKIYANTVTVFGNVTATLRDVYRRDLITIGTEHVGGLYGGGNLSLVNGYRELHIANYGTDYYGLQQQIDMNTYENELTDRERAYFRLRYTCLKDFKDGKDSEGISYKGHNVGDQIWEDEYKDLPESLKTVRPEGTTGGDYYWSLDGVCSIYAGRLLNTLQRADLAGVYGSRMVLQGARDRVTDVVDYTRYTINRVGELSLMKMDSPAGEEDDTNKTHGNYFGIYSLVNYLGNMTSDVLMDDVRTSDTNDTDANTSYWEWKHNNPNSRKRNTATSRNQVALASGVFLELTTENSTPEHKDYGYITGVVELDLINAKADAVGGGYVYAKNEHGKRSEVSDADHKTLSAYNATTRTYKMYTYSEATNNLEGIQTSGNFVHGQKKIIIDDCYPHNLEYTPGTENYSEAHYWYIKGSIYIYDQVLSAYTGSPTAYTRERHIPLTITAGSHGQLKLVNVQPNLYAYYADGTKTSKIGEDGIKVNNNSVTYKLNDVITYWDWSQLDANERELFVPKTMVTVAPCTYTTTSGESGSYDEGTVMLPEDYETLRASLLTKKIDGVDNVPYVHDEERGEDVAADQVFRMSNNLSHNTGYVISFEMDTPPDWDKWYSPKSGSGAISTATYTGKSDSEKDGYIPGPTFTTSAGGVYGQRMYTEDEIIPADVVNKYNDPDDGKQAVVSRAYVTKEQVSYDYQGTTKSVNPGTAISKTEYDALDAATKAKFDAAYVCTNTLKFNDENYILYGDLLNDAMISELASAFGKTVDEVKAYLSEAYICETAGMYGGTSYSTGTNYDALDGWASLTSADRESNKFTFNYDAFDVLADPNYSGPDNNGNMSQYGSPYCDVKPVEYVAIYHGDTPLNYSGGTLRKGEQLTREQYEQLPNEKYHYTPIHVATTAVDGDDYYIAKEAFSRGNVPYAKGQVITPGTYRALTDQERRDWVEVLHFTNTGSEETTYFYCRENYRGTVSVTDVRSSSSGTDVKAGWVISKEDYANLPNDQKDFTIKGNEPTEKTTLYVSRESDINDLSSEKIITVIYQYTYNEGSDDGDNVELVNELHIINIHLQFESGAPIVDPLQAPGVVLPGSTVGLKQPNVTPGAYELLGGGWEIFDNYTDAQHHRNGNEYSNNRTPMYWYQNQKYYVAYYAKSYLGKTYSNPVPFSVANYHDLADVMADKEHHMYVDYDPEKLVRNSKIYINDYSKLPADDPRKGQNGLDLLKDFYNLSLLTTAPAEGDNLAGHALLNRTARGGDNLDFILRSDLSMPNGSSWTSLGTDAASCFAGTLHGDGYTISGLDHSLFGNLCGEVYNLGVTGSFTEAGIADTGSGYIENCWVNTTGTPASGVKAVFGDPTRGSGYQVVNCYYPESNTYTSGAATMMPDKAFYNGTVAYRLNGFYLNKRYWDSSSGRSVLSGSSAESYNYLPAAADGSLPTSEQADEAYSTGSYPAPPDPQYGDIGYVERRYDNEDFIYAGGDVPEDADVRQRSVTDNDGITTFQYAPIWPDDYLFFGQTLTYGYNEALRPHQAEPAHIAKMGGRLAAGDESNRVYRAPAYFRNSTMGVAHYNPWANLAAKSADGTHEVYPGMTAIDFTGYDDVFKADDGLAKAYTLGGSGDAFYAPLLDNGGLTGIANRDLTRNLLVYIPQPTMTTGDGDQQVEVTNTADGMTRQTVISNASDPDYTDYYDENDAYRRVGSANASVNTHIVERKRTAAGATTYQSLYDHLLVDRQDFNAPIAYTFDGDHRMWYQRTPDRYAALNAGWEGISLPFEAELVTTQQKGELTHFYQGSTKGHEYWLRDYRDISSVTDDAEKAKAIMQYPNAGTEKKSYTNTFLWDYYYSKEAQRDANSDQYHQYYSKSHDYKGYPLLQKATPYIIGFPGTRYYEFDLSGNFVPQHTYGNIDKLSLQVITFASETGASIAVSDTEKAGVTHNGYTFKPNYLNEAFAAGTASTYTLNAEGSSYDKVPAEGEAVSVAAFRPYFVKAGGGARTRSIIFGDAEQSQLGGDGEHSDADQTGTLIIRPDKSMIIVKSTLDHTVDVRILSTAGVTLRTFTVEPGQTVDTPVLFSGVYIVRTDDGQYTRKLAVRNN